MKADRLPQVSLNLFQWKILHTILANSESPERSNTCATLYLGKYSSFNCHSKRIKNVTHWNPRLDSSILDTFYLGGTPQLKFLKFGFKFWNPYFPRKYSCPGSAGWNSNLQSIYPRPIFEPSVLLKCILFRSSNHFSNSEWKHISELNSSCAVNVFPSFLISNTLSAQKRTLCSSVHFGHHAKGC